MFWVGAVFALVALTFAVSGLLDSSVDDVSGSGFEVEELDRSLRRTGEPALVSQGVIGQLVVTTEYAKWVLVACAAVALMLPAWLGWWHVREEVECE